MKSKLTLSPAKFGRGMKQRRSARIVALSLALAALLAVGLTVGLRGSRAQSGAQQPDYSKVKNFLNGQKHILRDDDLIINFAVNVLPNDRSGWTNIGGSFSLATSNSNVSAQPVPAVPNNTPGCTAPCQYYWNPFFYKVDQESNQHDRGLAMGQAAGRFFNTDRDTFVQFPFQKNGNQGPLLVSLTGANAALSWSSSQEVNFVIGANAFISAVGDFNGDGYDDLLMNWLQVLCFTIFSEIDEGEGNKFEPEVTSLLGFIT